MTSDDKHQVSIELTARETVLPDAPGEWQAALAEAAEAAAGEGRRAEALRSVAAAYPLYLDVWADLAELAATEDDIVASYAFARVGYHRGLDALRGAGWRGAGRVRSVHPSNRGFLRSLAALGAAAAAIGESSEAARCADFLAELDPEPGSP